MRRKVNHIQQAISLEIQRNKWLYLILLLGFVLRCFYVFIFSQYQDYLVSDMGAYDERAMQLALGQDVGFPLYWAPGFHQFLGGFYWVLSKLGLLEFRLGLNIVLFSLLWVVSFWFIFKIVSRILSRKAAYFMLVILLLWYPFIYLNASVLSEHIFMPLFWGSVYFLITKPHRIRYVLIAGILWGLAAVTRNVLFPITLIPLLWLVLGKRSVTNSIYFLIGVVAVVLCQFVINLSVYSKNVLIAEGGGAQFALNWCELKTLEYRLGIDYYGFGPPGVQDSHTKQVVTEVPFSNQTFYYQMGIDCVQNDPAVLVRNLQSVTNVFDSVFFPVFPSIWGSRVLLSISKIVTVVLLYFAAMTCVFTRLDKTRLLLVGIFIANLICIYVQNPGEERYLVPFWPILVILAWPMLRKVTLKVRY